MLATFFITLPNPARPAPRKLSGCEHIERRRERFSKPLSL
jgi:hypothetical protein